LQRARVFSTLCLRHYFSTEIITTDWLRRSREGAAIHGPYHFPGGLGETLTLASEGPGLGARAVEFAA